MYDSPWTYQHINETMLSDAEFRFPFDELILVLLPENLRAYFELSAQAWILYKAPQWNARYPKSCPERIKLKMH
jgi:hypothetical protein